MPDKIFVYGTLRKEGTLSNMWPDTATFQQATMPGVLYEHSTGAYPVMIPAGVHRDEWEEAPVTGDLVTVNDVLSLSMKNLVGMEAGAGYNLQHAVAYDLLGHSHACYVFAWPWEDYGRHIECGDWLEYEVQQRLSGSTSRDYTRCGACGEWYERERGQQSTDPAFGTVCPDCVEFEFMVDLDERSKRHDLDERRRYVAEDCDNCGRAQNECGPLRTWCGTMRLCDTCYPYVDRDGFVGHDY